MPPTTPSRATDEGALAGEVRKLATARSLWGTLVAAGLAPVVLALYVGATGSLQPDDTVLGGALTGVVLGQALAGVVGALVMTSETASGTLALTLAAVPRRRLVLAAKAALVLVTTTVVGLVSSVVSLLLGSALIDGDHASGEPFPPLVGVGLSVGAIGVFGLGLGTLLRSTGGAVAAVVGVLLLPQVLGPLFGDLQPWVMGVSPATTPQKMTQSSDATAEVAGSLGPWPSLLALAAVGLVLVALAARSLDRRDV